MKKTAIAAGIAAAAGIGLAACGGTSITKAPHVSHPPSAPAAPAAAPATPPTSGPLRTTFTVTGTADNGSPESYDVTLKQVLDPAGPDNEFDAAPSGDRLVGAEVTVTGVAGTSADDVNSDIAAIGSNGEVYQPEFGGLAAGTNFNAGQWTVTPGQSETGWAAFQVPDGVSITSFQWSPFLSNAVATWTV
jgi:hypothetical protein